MTRPLALVTGGVRRLGAVIAARLAEAGYDLALSSHSDGTPEARLAEAIEQHASNWRHFPADLSDPANAEKLIAAVSAHFGRAPELLVNNAAMFGQDGWTQMDAASLEAHFRLNLFTPLLLSKALVSRHLPSGQPAIVHIVDQRVRNPNGDQLSYTLSKQALAASVRSMAAALAPHARVNGVAPGLVIPTDDYSGEQMSSLSAKMPLGQLPSAESVAEAVLFLATAPHISGQIIFADAGAHLKSYDRDFLFL